MTKFSVQSLGNINRAFAALGGSLSDSRVIMADDGKQQIPLFTVSAASDEFPLSVSALAENFAALLGDNQQPHALKTDGVQIFYRSLPSGVSLHYRTPDGGVSKEGLLFVVSDKASSQALGEAAVKKITRAFMQELCDAIAMGGSATPTSGTRPKTPAL